MRVYNYLVEDKGRIIYLGDLLPDEFSQAKAEYIDLGGRALLSTFADAHSHFLPYAVMPLNLDLGNCDTDTEALEKLRQRSKLSNSAIVATNLDITKIDLDKLNKTVLDTVTAKNQSAVVISRDGHSAVVNSVLLKKLWSNLNGKQGADADSGIMRGRACYEVCDNLGLLYPFYKVVCNLQRALDEYARVGIGLISCQVGNGYKSFLDVKLLKLLAKGSRNCPQIRIFIQTFDTNIIKKFRLNRLGGCFDTALDGSISSRDAALFEPYENSLDCGRLYYTDEQLFEKISSAHNQGYQIQMHAIGDKAFDQGARVLKKVLDLYPRPNHRHALIHCTLTTDRGIEICRKYAIQTIVQPSFIDLNCENTEELTKVLGERAKNAENYRQFFDNGISCCASSDAPVTIPNPIEWIYRVCNDGNATHRLTVEQALTQATFNGYYSTFDEAERGSLAVGKVADMVILSANPLVTPKDKLNQIQVVDTIINGKSYRYGKSGLNSIIRGIFAPSKAKF